MFHQARKMGALLLAFLSTNHIWRPRLQDSKVCGKICSFAEKEPKNGKIAYILKKRRFKGTRKNMIFCPTQLIVE